MATVENNTTTSSLEALGLTRPQADQRNGQEMGSAQFMELMLAQMRNQDPLKPMENGDFLAQIAQFSTVSGVQELQNSFSSLAASLTSNQALQASTLVGRTVAVPSDVAVLDASGTATQGRIMVPASTGSLTLGIYDEAGQLVREIDLGTQPAGDVAFTWDGLDGNGAALPPGTYTLKAEASIDDQTYALETYVNAQVQSVDLGAGQGIRLNLAGLGTVNFTDVQQIM